MSAASGLVNASARYLARKTELGKTGPTGVTCGRCTSGLLWMQEGTAEMTEEDKDAQESSLYKEDSFRMYCMKVCLSADLARHWSCLPQIVLCTLSNTRSIPACHLSAMSGQCPDRLTFQDFHVGPALLKAVLP